MDRTAALDRMRSCGIIAVVRTSSADEAQRAVEAIVKGGISVVEVTFTVPRAAEVIASLARSIGSEVILGAGTVTDVRKAEAAIEAGAQFIVAPNTDGETISRTVSLGAVAIPGALTPTEVVNAVRAGADAVKIFPASLFGPAYLRALRGPLPDVRYVPTGGITPENLPEFVRAGAAMVGVGGSLVAPKLVAAGAYEAITERARIFVEVMQRARAKG